MLEQLDRIIAKALEVSVEEYIDTIETISLEEGEFILDAVLSGDEERVEEAKRIFKKLKYE